MPKTPNYLLGHGENLTLPIDHKRGGGNKFHPYSFAEAKETISKKAEETSRALDLLPRAACPNDQAVAVLTMHPSYLAKTYSPVALLAAAGLRTVGSRGVTIVPQKPPKNMPPGERIGTTELFVAGTRRQFRDFAANLPNWVETTDGATEVIRLEDFRSPDPVERIRPLRSDATNPLLEVVLHEAGLKLDYVIESFRRFMRGKNLEVDFGRNLKVGSLLFLPVRLPRDQVHSIAEFAFLRVAREMPSLWWSDHTFKGILNQAERRPCRLPSHEPLDSSVVAAVFDGGLPQTPCLKTWVNSLEVEGIGPAEPKFLDHGLAVTSAMLFGPLDEDHAAQVPYSRVDHYRVIDVDTLSDPQTQLYPVLERIVRTLKEKTYQYVNFSIGPDQPVEDDEVSAWTAVLDQLFANGETLVTAAVGNSGERDAESGLNRIQSPSDGVNILAIAACERSVGMFTRAAYSSVGPGRNPGRRKPDLSIFGGTEEDPFYVLASGVDGEIMPICGTSIASPNALRVGLGVRVSLGDPLTPLAVRTLMVHRSEESRGIDEDDPEHDRTQLGWGRTKTHLDELLTCHDDMVYVVYQGIIQPKQYLRAQIPTPSEPLTGMVHFAATICFASQVDPEHPPNYTRSGVEVVFRPHSDKFTTKTHPKTGKKQKSSTAEPKPFFSMPNSTNEMKLRDDGKWETTLCAYKSMQGKNIYNPVFELHHNPRLGGANVTGAEPIPYAMIIQVKAEKIKNFYNLVYTRFRGILEPLKPKLDISIRY